MKKIKIFNNIAELIEENGYVTHRISRENEEGQLLIDQIINSQEREVINVDKDADMSKSEDPSFDWNQTLED